MKNEFTERWRARILAAQIDLIDAYGGPKRVIEKAHYSKSQVYRWYGGADRDFMSVPVVMALEADCERPIITSIMAEFSGCDLSDAEGDGSDMSCLSALTAEHVEISGQMVVETVRARADGVITPNEAQRLRDLSRKAEALRAQIDSVLAGAQAGEGLRVVS